MAAALCALVGARVQAIDFDGYFRAGTGDADKPDRTCYDLAISGGHYRLGNECDAYFELGVAHAIAVDGVTVRGKAMVNFQRPAPDGSSSTSGLEQLYVEAQGLAFAPDARVWLGERFYGRADVHILDTWFVRMDGAGVGADRIALGGGAKLGVAYFRTDAGSGAPPGTDPSGELSRRFNVDVTDIDVGSEAGTLRVTTTFTRGHGSADAGAAGGTSGFGLGVQHDKAWATTGATHRAWLQYAHGSAGLDGNFGAPGTPPQVKQWRLVESLTWQAGAFGGQAVALVGRHDADAARGIPARYSEWSIGGRLSYAVTPHVKLLVEAGHMQKRPDGADPQRLTKLTVAPAWSTGPRWQDRPELRIYVTTARWNDAANAAAGSGGLTGLADGKTRGTSWGAQLETWF